MKLTGVGTMSQEIVRWRCIFLKCSWLNWATKEELPARIKDRCICENCGIGAIAPEKPTASGDGWLCGLCEFPAEVNRFPPGQVGLGWVDGSACGPDKNDKTSTYTRRGYIERFGVDPLINYYFTHPNEKRPPELIPRPLPDTNSGPIIDPPEPPSDLKRANEQINKALDKALELRNKNILTEEKYGIIRRVLKRFRKERELGIITDAKLEEELKQMWERFSINA